MKNFNKKSNDNFFKKVLNRKFKKLKLLELAQTDYKNFLFSFSDSQKISDIKDKLIVCYNNMSLTNSEKKELNDRFKGMSFREAFIKNYFKGEQARCCFCGQILEVAINKQGKKYIIADIEHILPKSKFPQFTLHPNNWAPCCKECNQSIKGDDFFATEPFENFKTAIETLGLDINNLHPLKLWEHLKISYDNEFNIKINPNLSKIAKEFLNFYGIEDRAKIISNRCYDILFNIIKKSEIRSPESLERLLENMASANWHDINDGYSLNNSPQIWQEFTENILYDENKLLALWDEIKAMYSLNYNLAI